MEFIVDGQRLYYETKGEGDCLLFLHGWGGSTKSFEGAYNSFSKNFRVVNIDFMGFGESDKPASALTLDCFVNQVCALLDTLGVKRTVVVGHSFGGRVAIKLAAARPLLVHALVLVDSAGLKPKFSLKKYLAVRAYRRAKRKGRDVSKYGSKDYRALDGCMRATFVNVVNEDLTPYLKHICVPTLIVWGKSDKETPPYMARRLNKKIADSGLVLLEGGHYSYIDSFSTFVRVLDSFFASLTEGRVTL